MRIGEEKGEAVAFAIVVLKNEEFCSGFSLVLDV